jgi:hypothetical protein
LEHRALLTGNVTASFDGTTLSIIADNPNTAELVRVRQTGDSWTVEGIGTTVNGSSSPQLFGDSVEPVIDILADLQGGSDYLRIANGTLDGGVSAIFSGGGNKNVQIVNLTTELAVAVTTLGGNDSIQLLSLHVGGNVTVDAGNGNNFIFASNVRSQGDDSFVTGSGRDVVSLSGYSAPAGLSIVTGDGNDVVSLYRVDVSDAGLGVDVGPGNYDVLTVINCTAGTEELLDTGGTNGIIIGAMNHFATPASVIGFRFRFGI